MQGATGEKPVYNPAAMHASAVITIFMKQFLVLVLLAFLNLSPALAQRTLVIQNLEGSRRYEFQEGEKLKLKLREGGAVVQGDWRAAAANTIWVAGKVIVLRDIRWIDVSEKEKGVWLLRKGQDLLLLAGIGYFTVAHVNIPIETGAFALDRSVARTSAIMVAGGLLCRGVDRILHRRKIPLNRGRFGVSLIR